MASDQTHGLLQNKFVRLYLECVEETQSPRLFHIWSALAGVGAALGRRNYLPFGPFKIYPNLYVILVGPPGLKKGSAMNISKNFVQLNTGVKFAPKDTSGRYQGIIAAMEDTDVDNKLKEELHMEMSFADLGNLNTDIEAREDKHSMFVASSEWATFIGINNHSFLNFLIEVWDGEDYEYRLKKERFVIKEPLMGMIGCTTSTGIATCIPEEAMGHGFMSRLILVYSSRPYKRVDWPPPLPSELEKEIGEVYKNIHKNLTGPFIITPEVKEQFSIENGKEVKIDDHRFMYYLERRQTHLFKLTMCLTAARQSKQIEIQDIIDANALLSLTELNMPMALGEYGMSPRAVAAQRVIEFLQQVKEPVNSVTLMAYMIRDLPSKNEYFQLMEDLVISEKIVRLSLPNNEIAYTVPASVEELNTLRELLGSNGVVTSSNDPT